MSNANYLVAWSLLKERFNNKKLIVNAHIKTIIELPNLRTESNLHLRKLLDNFNKNFRSLTALGLPTDQWDAILIYIICGKLDIDTRRA